MIASERLSEMLNNASIDRVMAINNEWKIIAWNRASELFTGLAASVVLGEPVTRVFPAMESDLKFTRAFQTALKGFKAFLPADPRFAHRSYFESHFIPLEDENGDIAGAMQIMHDVSHRIEAEKQLLQLNAALRYKYRQLEEAYADIASYTYLTSQNIKEPMRQLYLALERIIRTEAGKLSDSSRASFRRMQTSFNRMNLLLEDILSVSGISSQAKGGRQVNLQCLVDRVKEALASKIEEKNALIIAIDLPVFFGYEELLYQLFYNLIDNAIKFQPDDRIPVVSVKATPWEEPEDSGFQYRSWLKLSFADNGMGVMPGEEDRIFRLFEGPAVPGKNAHYGKGLAVCKKIADLHGGRIRVVSNAGAGSGFEVFLPVISEEHISGAGTTAALTAGTTE